MDGRFLKYSYHIRQLYNRRGNIQIYDSEHKTGKSTS